MLRGSELKCLMDFGNVTRLRTEMFAGLRKCYAAPNRNVCWTSEMLRGSDFAAARPGQAMLDKSYVALRSCPRHYFTHVKACSCLFLLAFLHNGLLWHGHIGHAVISVGIFKVFYASVLSLVVARRRLDLLFFFSLCRHISSVSLVRGTGSTPTACLSGASFRNLDRNLSLQACLSAQRSTSISREDHSACSGVCLVCGVYFHRG